MTVKEDVCDLFEANTYSGSPLEVFAGQELEEKWLPTQLGQNNDRSVRNNKQQAQRYLRYEMPTLVVY